MKEALSRDYWRDEAIRSTSSLCRTFHSRTPLPEKHVPERNFDKPGGIAYIPPIVFYLLN